MISAALWYVVAPARDIERLLRWLREERQDRVAHGGAQSGFLVLDSTVAAYPEPAALGPEWSLGLDRSRGGVEPFVHLWLLAWADNGQRPVDWLRAEAMSRSLGIRADLIRSDLRIVDASKLAVDRGEVWTDGLHVGRALVFGRYALDAESRELRMGKEAVHLRPKEFELLFALARREGKVARSEDLLREVWGYSRDVQTRTLQAHIALLREKLEAEVHHPRLILTVRTIGYRLAGARWADAR